jgi:hypothetical protein
MGETGRNLEVLTGKNDQRFPFRHAIPLLDTNLIDRGRKPGGKIDLGGLEGARIAKGKEVIFQNPVQRGSDTGSQ